MMKENYKIHVQPGVLKSQIAKGTSPWPKSKLVQNTKA